MSGKVLAVTCRSLFAGDFLEQVARLADSPIQGIILREKDLPEEAYEGLAGEVLALCRSKGMPCILHTYVGAAVRLGCREIHLPLPLLRKLSKEMHSCFDTIGVSVHSSEEAVEAAHLGATYLTAGHIFDTDCKAGLPGRGLDFLGEVCRKVSIPVYAIGGITPRNLPEVVEAGAQGGCMMSALMRCEEPWNYLF